jgi:hypothetical protein
VIDESMKENDYQKKKMKVAKWRIMKI